jgi:uncharacterized membrane protein
MFVCGSFAYNFHLELAISELEKKGIPGDAIAAILMDSRVEERKILDTIHRADGISSFDAAALLGTFCMLAGAIYGFVLHWGPIIWGLIGLLAGSLLGLLGDVLISQMHLKNLPKSRTTGTAKGESPQVFIIVECSNEQVAMVKEKLWDNLALGVGTLSG